MEQQAIAAEGGLQSDFAAADGRDIAAVKIANLTALVISLEEKEASAAAPQIRQCPKWDGKPLTIDVSKSVVPVERRRRGRLGAFKQQQAIAAEGGLQSDFAAVLQRQCRDRQRRQNHSAARLRQQWPAAA
jgi:hypothetical protein